MTTPLSSRAPRRRRLAQAITTVALLLAGSDALADETIVNNVNISNLSTHNILITVANSEAETFPYDQAYGPTNYWTKYDVIRNDNGTYSFHVNGKYLSAADNGKLLMSSTKGVAECFELEASVKGSYTLKTYRGTYVSSGGTGWKDTVDSDTIDDESRWYFHDPINPVTDGMNNANMIATVNKNAIILATNSDPKTFPYEQSYGLFNYWTKWDAVENDDGTYSFHLNGKYLSTDDTGFTGVDTSITNDARYTMVAGQHGSYHLETAYGTYLTPGGTGWKDLSVANEMSDDTRWNLPVSISVATPTYRYDYLDGVNETWSSATFDYAFNSAPVVIADMQTKKGNNTTGLRIDAVGADGFEVFAEEEASKDTELEHADETIAYLAFDAGIIYDANGNAVGEAGTIDASQASHTEWKTLNNLALSYQNPVVRMTMNTYNGAHQSHIRLENVGSNSLQYQIEEWEYLNGTHGQETIAYVIVEAGVHELTGGSILQAQTTSLDHNFATVNFSQAYTGTPMVFSQSQTEADADPVVTRQRSIDSSSLEIQLQEEEGMDGNHGFETVGVISIGK